MNNTQFFKGNKTRTWLRCGTRAALLFESEMLAGDTLMARHLRELERALLAHAEREYLPAAAAELEALASAGRGYDFVPHRLRFCAKARLLRGRVQLELSLQYTGSARAPRVQHAWQIWSADGAYRLR